jgi:hypothetical protein
MAWLPQATKLLRTGADAALTADAVHQTTSRGETDHLVECTVDSLGESSGAEDSPGLRQLLSVDDQRSLVSFGYLFGHEWIS